MSDGVLLVDKPAGPSSHDVVGAVRRALAIARVGHAGTLDPPASGLLVVLVGRATRLARFIAMLPKRYEAMIRFGWETTTDDAAGDVVGERDEAWRSWSAADLERALADVRRRPEQVPPPVSAKKVDGERAYRRFRRGETTPLRPVPVTIFSLQLATFRGTEGTADIAVECSSGTYVRAIARDVGRALGTRAHLASLRRTGIGTWNLSDALPLDALAPSAIGQTPSTIGHPQSDIGSPSFGLRPMAEAVAHLPAAILPAADARRFATGQKIAADAPAGPVAVFDPAGLVGVADAHDGLLHPDVVLVG